MFCFDFLLDIKIKHLINFNKYLKFSETFLKNVFYLIFDFIFTQEK